MRLLIVYIAFLLSACTTISSNQLTEEIQDWPELPMSKNLTILQPEQSDLFLDIYSLTEKQKQTFFAYYNNPKNHHLLPNKKISLYLRDELTNFNFYFDTLTASQAIARRQGNCLSLAIVTRALADLVNVEVKYELVATPPIYQKNGDFVFVSQHVRTLLLDPKPGEIEGYYPMWRGFIRVDYFPSNGTHRLRGVKEREFYSMYYNNKAAEALSQDKDGIAFWYLKQSLNVNKADAQTINMIAIIHQRAGYPKNAEELYRYGLKYGGENFELLSNYYELLSDLDRSEDAASISKRLKKYKDPNPYKWINLANQKFEEKSYSSAIYYYKKANKMANYLHEGHAGIARVQYLLGNLNLAQKYIKKAIENSNNPEVDAIYKAEYRLFTQQHNDG